MSGDLPSPAVAACLRALEGTGTGNWTLESVVACRDNSRIHRARSQTRTAAIKECFKRATLSPDCAAAVREYTALETLLERTSRAGVRPLAPLPWTLCREHGVYAMAWVGGDTCTNLLLRSSTKQAEALGESAGHWLRRFHETSALSPRRNDFEEKLKYVNQFAKAAGGVAPLLLRAADVLGHLAPDAAARTLPASWLHGDFKPDNLLIDQDGVTGLDVQLAFENTVVYDLAPFLNNLFLLRWSPRGFWQRRKLEAVARTFLGAYASDAEHWRLPILWLRAYLLMQVAVPVDSSASLRARLGHRAACIELARATKDMEKYR